MQQPEPNLIAETYRNQVTQIPRRFEKHYDFVDVNQDEVFLLGTSNMSGRIWSGSMWLFNDPADPPDVDKCIAGLEFESGISVGKWFSNGSNIVVGSDSGALNLLLLNKMVDVDKNYLSTLAIISEHDDSITALDVSSDSQKMLSGSMDMNIKIWDAETATSERTYDYAHCHTVTSTCFQPGRQDVFMSTSIDGNSLIWDSSLEKPASLILKTDSGYTSSCWIDENSVALGANSGTVSLVDLRMKSELDRYFCSKRPMYNMAYDKETQLLAVCGDDAVVRVFSCSDRLLSCVYECERHKDFVRGLTWKSPNHLYSCGWDSVLLFHNVVHNKGSGSNTGDVTNGAQSQVEE